MALVTAKVTWLRWLLADFGVSCLYHSSFEALVLLVLLVIPRELTKHIGVDAYYTRATRDGVVTLRYVPSELRLADFLTKARQITSQN
ncbi:LOW QUALITY PROTEIN: hypothetical protein U9M48_021427 [Paspalum notatum var. saurae]|uniref:Uncharacterized protein n=1 Tax=Paspalum notatum var. saurae TaxID=547442 RepID=A0AAQ3TFM3_PASNO